MAYDPEYDPEFLEFWEKYFKNAPPPTRKLSAYHGWIARGHLELLKKIDKDLKINEK